MKGQRRRDRQRQRERERENQTIVYQRLKQTHRRRWLWSAGLIYRVRRSRAASQRGTGVPLVPVSSLYPPEKHLLATAISRGKSYTGELYGRFTGAIPSARKEMYYRRQAANSTGILTARDNIRRRGKFRRRRNLSEEIYEPVSWPSLVPLPSPLSTSSRALFVSNVSSMKFSTIGRRSSPPGSFARGYSCLSSCSRWNLGYFQLTGRYRAKIRLPRWQDSRGGRGSTSSSRRYASGISTRLLRQAIRSFSPSDDKRTNEVQRQERSSSTRSKQTTILQFLQFLQFLTTAFKLNFITSWLAKFVRLLNFRFFDKSVCKIIFVVWKIIRVIKMRD